MRDEARSRPLMFIKLPRYSIADRSAVLSTQVEAAAEAEAQNDEEDEEAAPWDVSREVATTTSTLLLLATTNYY